MAGTRHESADELIEMALSMPQGETRHRLLGEAARAADAAKDLPLAFKARFQIVEDHYFVDHSETFLTAFSWCLHHLKQDRKQFGYSSYSMTWYFKSVIGNAMRFPDISLAQLEALLDEMAAWYQQEGYNQRPIIKRRASLAKHRGDMKSAQEYFTEMQAMKGDGMADCPACEADYALTFYAALSKYKKALRTAQPIIDGDLSCLSVPHRTYCSLFEIYEALGMPEEADQCHVKGYRLIRNDATSVWEVTEHIEHLLRRKNEARALQLLERHVPWALSTTDPLNKFCYYQVFRKAMHSLLTKRRSRKTRQLRLPPEFPLYNREGKYEVQALYNWALGEERSLAVRFDRRNGTDKFCRQLPEDEKP